MITNQKPKICMTASGYLVHQGKILLIKHKKLKAWLPPGGHIDKGELPHEAAQREFWEETAIKVRAVDYVSDNFMPVPFKCGLHWVSRENYQRRQSGEKPLDVWKKGCEQHYDQGFLVEAVNGMEYKKNVEETDGIAWFSEKEIGMVKTFDDVRGGVKIAFRIYHEKR